MGVVIAGLTRNLLIKGMLKQVQHDALPTDDYRLMTMIASIRYERNRKSV